MFVVSPWLLAGAVGDKIVRLHNTGLYILCLWALKSVHVKSVNVCVMFCFVPTSAFVFPAWSWTGSGPVACDAAGNGNGTRLFSGYSRRESYNRSGL